MASSLMFISGSVTFFAVYRTEVSMKHGSSPSGVAPTDKGVRWWLVGCLSAVAYVSGCIGFWEYGLHHHPGQTSLLNPLYHSLQLFILHTPHLEPPLNIWLEIGRWLAPGVLFWAAIKGFMQVFRQQMNLLNLRRWQGHVVVCGLGRRGLQVVKCARGQGKKVVAIEQSGDNSLIRTAEELGATVLVGDVTDSDLLRMAGVARAGRIVAICGEDATNLEIAVRVRELLPDPAGPDTPRPHCQVQLTDIALRHSLQHAHAKSGPRRKADALFFDIYESQVRELLERHPLDGAGIGPDDPRQAHLVIIGFGRLGECLALKAAQMGHYANAKPLRISVIDRSAPLKRDRLFFRHPAIAQVCAIDFHHQEMESVASREFLLSCCNDKQSIVTIAVCFDDDCRSLDVGIRLMELSKGFTGTIALRLSSNQGMAKVLEYFGADADLPRPKVFGTIHDGCDADDLDNPRQDRMAKAIHENFVLKRTTTERTAAIDPALRPWAELENPLYKDSNRQQADHIGTKLRAIGCEIAPVSDPRPAVTLTKDDIELLAELEHARWVGERTLAGWTYAPGKKNVKLKTTPYLVPWSELADEIRQYDRDAVLEIPAVLEIVHSKICRQPTGLTRSR
jgi:predicted ThiF/HesA family dinucleotide-utilizing enzyme